MGFQNSYALLMPFAPLADSVHKDRLQLFALVKNGNKVKRAATPRETNRQSAARRVEGRSPVKFSADSR